MGISCDMPSFFGYVGFVMFVPVRLSLVATLPAKLSGSIDDPFADMDRSHKNRITPVRITRFWANLSSFPTID